MPEGLASNFSASLMLCLTAHPGTAWEKSKPMPTSLLKIILALHLISSCSIAQVFVDINPDNGRSDVRTAAVTNLPVGLSSELATSIGDVNIKLRTTTRDTKLNFAWWKAGYDVGATLASDGVTTEQPGEAIELVLGGLTAGRHSITTWHNQTTVSREPQHIEIQVDDGPAMIVECTSCVLHDEDAATAYLEFDVVAGRDNVVRIRPKEKSQHVILNALRLDAPDPSRRIKRIKHRSLAAWGEPKLNSKHCTSFQSSVGQL